MTAEGRRRGEERIRDFGLRRICVFVNSRSEVMRFYLILVSCSCSDSAVLTHLRAPDHRSLDRHQSRWLVGRGG